MDPREALAHDAEQQRQRILSLPAGRDLDAEIQRVVFRSEVVRCRSLALGGVSSVDWHFNVYPADEPDHISAQPLIPPYSTEAGAAWAMLDRFWAVSIDRCDGVSPRYAVTINARDGRTWDARDDSFPLAAAQAALLATLEARPR